MAEEKFDLVFRGELVPGAELGQVKQNLARLFKMDSARIEKLFSGRAIVLKRGMSMDAAAQYRIAIKKAGARLDTVPSKAEPKAAAPAAPKPVSAVSRPAEDARPSRSSAPQPGAGAPPGGDLLTLAPAGATLVEAAPEGAPERQVDTEHLSLRSGGGVLVDEHEIARAGAVAVRGEDFGLAPAGADVLKPEERSVAPQVDLDLSHLSAEVPGERLEAPKPPPPPAPDISRLSLVEE